MVDNLSLFAWVVVCLLNRRVNVLLARCYFVGIMSTGFNILLVCEEVG